MFVTKLEDAAGIPGPYKGITHHYLADSKNGFNNFEIIYSTTEKGSVGKSHSHPDSEHMQLVLEGSLRIVAPDGKTYDVPSGSAVFIQPGEEHEVVNTHDGTTRYLVVYAPPHN